ncbi:MAG TPA: HDOD domain-containing protein [Verrucomicrobiae bacterium]|nr:HDOD domain-containing protein [Verrucomicrobiae bacterium]
MTSIDEYLARASHLVPAPHVLPRLIPLLNDPQANTTKIVELISYDASLTGNVLRLCNSAYYTRGAPMDSVLQAVTRLGSREVYRIVVAVTGAASLSTQTKGYSIESTGLWTHSVATALLAQAIAEDVGEDGDVAFTAGLLHDVGKIVLSPPLENVSKEFAAETATVPSVVFAEQKLLGCDHAQVGGRLMERWKLPDKLAAAVGNHHDPTAPGHHQHLAACVCLANALAYFMGHGFGHHTLSLSGRDQASAILNVSMDRLPKYVDQCFEKLRAVKGLYNLKV